MPQPALKVNDLIARINQAFMEDDLNSLALRHFEEEAYSLRHANIGAGDMVLGILAAIKGDVALANRRFKNALAFCGPERRDDVIFNYGHSLYVLGDYNGAIQLLLPIAEKNRDAALNVAHACKALGLASKAEYFFSMCGGDTPDFKQASEQSARARLNFVQKGFDAVRKSFARDRAIWESLSDR